MIAIAHNIVRALLLWRPEAFLLAAIGATAAIGAFSDVQDELFDFALSTVKRPMSGEIVLVQIDKKSLDAVPEWPWTRDKHAKALDTLVQAGAELVAFDVMFSSALTEDGDKQLAETIRAHSGRVILPSFVQHVAPGQSAELEETNPLPALRDGSLIGNANLFAPKGVTRRASIGLYLPDGRYRPTFAGLVGQEGGGFINEFDIDFSLDLKSLRRLSFVDVLNGQFDPKVVKGKRVIIGATAIELGDRAPVPVYGVIAGVELQALASESVLQGRTLIPMGLAGQILIAALVLVFLRPSRAQWSLKGFGAPAAAAAVALAALPLAVLAGLPILLETAAGFTALAVSMVYVGASELSARARAVVRERGAANTRRAMISLIVEQSSDGVLVCGIHGRIELINERAAHLVSATRSTMLGRKVPSVLPRFQDLARGENGDPTVRHSEVTLDTDGATATLEVTIRRMVLPAMEGSAESQIDVYTLHDVTAQRQAAEAERRAQEERFMTERAKSNFIANMSHELRTPLNAIIGFSEMMARQTLGPLGSPAYVEYSEVVAKSGQHLLALINNVLEISRLDQNTSSVEIDPLDFNESAGQAISFVRTLRDYKNQAITVDCAEHLSFASDQRLMKYILINLLSNAVKFSGEGSAVAIAARFDGDDFVFSVSDNGVGIDPKLLPHLTQMFYQTDSNFTRKHDGMGVGLYLVKRHVDLLNGSLTFTSEQGKGTTVTVRLPRAARDDLVDEAA